MKSAIEWKSERWEGSDFIVTGFGMQHPGVFSKSEADLIVKTLRHATPIIQKDAWKQGVTDAAHVPIKYAVDTGRTPVNGMRHLIEDGRGEIDEVRKTYSQAILKLRGETKTV